MRKRFTPEIPKLSWVLFLLSRHNISVQLEGLSLYAQIITIKMQYSV